MWAEGARWAYASGMSDSPGAIGPSAAPEAGGAGPAWEAAEILGAAVLGGVGILAMGGLAVGIARIAVIQEPFANSQYSWNAIEFGAEWANFVVAVIVLGVLGLCWWQLQAWTAVVEDPEEAGQLPDALGHIRRAGQLTRWAEVALGLTLLGSVAGFAASVGTGGTTQLWVLDLIAGAQMLAVIVIFVAGIVVGRQLGRGYGLPSSR